MAKPIATHPLCIAADVLERFMKDNGYALCNGSIYKRTDDSLYTYVYCLSVYDFLLRALASSEISNAIISHIGALSMLLSKPACRLIKPLTIIHNVIECLPPGFCFIISLKKFVKLERFPKDCSPRTFIRYTFNPDVVPYPRPFIQGKNVGCFSLIAFSKGS